MPEMDFSKYIDTSKIENIIDSKDKISSKNARVSNSPVQKIKYNREQLLSKQTAKELNTYLNFGVFPTFADTFNTEYDENNNYELKESNVGTPGVRSIFNRAGAVLLGTSSSDGKYSVDITNGDEVHDWRINNNVPLMDSPKARQRIRKTSGCSIRELVEASSRGELGQETYAYSDFMYCKHLGKVPNNYMITLRRFPLPIDDFIGFDGIDRDDKNGAIASIGCMVTWMGVSGNDLSALLSYNYKMPFREETADEQDVDQFSSDSNATLLNGMFSMFDPEYRKQYQEGYAGEALNEVLKSKFNIDLGAPPYKDYARFRDKMKVYGPIDSIRSTYVRDDKGLVFDQKLSIVFEYELKSYNGINGKQAMLDLISNILNVTYTTGSFWGGGYKGYASHQSNIFANLNIFKAKGGYANYVNALSQDMANMNSAVKNKINETGGFKQALSALKSNIGGVLAAGLLNKFGRPRKAYYNSLLSPAPIGFWHVTIGNPKRPIMSIGNMIITDVKIEHNGPLGIDDFPTGLKVTVQLDRGKPRDLRDIEKLYMQGTDRIYSSMSDKVFDMYKNSQLYKRNGKNYSPVTNVAEYKEEPTKITPTITINDYNSIKNNLKKYFGTTDSYAIYVAATEQEYGSTKPSTKSNENTVGDRNGK